MRIEVIQADITRITADVIVNAANSSLMGGGGVDGAIHRAGGAAILEDCYKIVARQGGCRTGEAVITTAGKLNAKYVIHTVGPVWQGGSKNEHELLANCYKNSLLLADEYQCRIVAFPAISTGIYRFPVLEAAQIAVRTVAEFLKQSSGIEKAIFVCLDKENFNGIKDQIEKITPV